MTHKGRPLLAFALALPLALAACSGGQVSEESYAPQPVTLQ